ncbi:MAG: hypothetical protein WC083_05630 [Candidatus Methanomethylophilaceae archaeon]
MAILLDDITLILTCLVAASGYIGLALVATEVHRWVPEWRTFAKARKKNLPIIAYTVHGSGETDWILGSKDEKGDPVFDTSGQFGIQVDPKFSGEIVPDRLQKGLRIYHYGTTTPLALDGRHCMAIQTCITMVRDEYPQLQFLTNDQVLALLNTARDDLARYCESIYEMAATAAVEANVHSAEALTNLIIAAQDLTAKTEIPGSGFFSYAFAFKNTPTAYLSQDLHQYGLLIERKVRKQMDDISKKYAMILVFAFGALMIIIGGAVAYTIIK